MTEDSLAREIREATTVNVPAGMAYNPWIQFADFPRFIFGAERVIQLVWEPDSVVEKICVTRGFDCTHLRGDLLRFKESLEEHGHKPRSWSSSVIEGHVQQAVESDSHGMKPIRTIRSHEGGGEDAGADPVAP